MVWPKTAVCDRSLYRPLLYSASSDVRSCLWSAALKLFSDTEKCSWSCIIHFELLQARVLGFKGKLVDQCGPRGVFETFWVNPKIHEDWNYSSSKRESFGCGPGRNWVYTGKKLVLPTSNTDQTLLAVPRGVSLIHNSEGNPYQPGFSRSCCCGGIQT